MKVRILGCGTSTGVPKIGNDWGQCDPNEPRNARLRTSILVESANERMLVDCGPDLRQQLLAADVSRLDGVIVTHAHGDHCHGLDELRPVSQAIGRAAKEVCFSGLITPSHASPGRRNIVVFPQKLRAGEALSAPVLKPVALK